MPSCFYGIRFALHVAFLAVGRAAQSKQTQIPFLL